MLNQTVLVGRIVEIADIKEEKNERKSTIITIAVTRCYKNIKGEYDADLINCILWNAIATNTIEHCQKGDIIGIKGRLEANENKELQVIAEKVTFLSSKNKEEA